ncbi:hypothetical protein DUNSADRAFT_12362 [Dunaliella salina]|uniref:Uncharacterized protein n=1 Tax=Dunaliella salina TaxID=3046 RepID=A0ABQ7GBG2_DUNSA|nr:hypothetical protein DUNSADRAFT_12362 [Dunaliella salina]|eukprot:KAF5831947.1 hypothetical protein DUNSADRAFT_12362 [Dunaliella salina]
MGLFTTFAQELALHSTLGVVCGILIEVIVRSVSRLISTNTTFSDGDGTVRRSIFFALVLHQLVLNIIFMWALISVLPEPVVMQWQNSTSGLAFGALLFNIQQSLYSNIVHALNI